MIKKLLSAKQNNKRTKSKNTLKLEHKLITENLRMLRSKYLVAPVNKATRLAVMLPSCAKPLYSGFDQLAW